MGDQSEGIGAVTRAANPRRVGLWAICVWGLLGASPLMSQLPTASAADLGLGSTRTATVFGFAAIATNPAGLGGGTGGFTLAFLPIAASSGLDPIQLSDLARYSDRVVPDAVREEWLNRVRLNGGQSGSVGVSATGLALTVGNLGFQLSTRAAGTLRLNSDATELVLFGNAGRTGEPEDFVLDGSRIDGFAVSTAAISWGAKVARNLAVGATGKFMAGNGVVVARDGGSAVTNDPVALNLKFPSLVTAAASNGHDSGSGVGLDVGAQWWQDDWGFGATVRNVFNTFAWDRDKLTYRPGTALFDGSDSQSDFEERPGAAAPASLLTALADLTFEPEVSLGASWQAGSQVSLSGEVRNRFGDGMAFEPAFQLGVGAEFTAIPWMPLRLHTAKISGGLQVGGGASLILGSLQASWALARRTGPDDQVVAAFSLTWGSR